ncbi:MAG: hypothetical protein MJZ50_05225 [Treponema sp.]|nr:hypothetical protein [Treponema sp.]
MNKTLKKNILKIAKIPIYIFEAIIEDTKEQELELIKKEEERIKKEEEREKQKHREIVNFIVDRKYENEYWYNFLDDSDYNFIKINVWRGSSKETLRNKIITWYNENKSEIDAEIRALRKKEENKINSKTSKKQKDLHFNTIKNEVETNLKRLSRNVATLQKTIEEVDFELLNMIEENLNILRNNKENLTDDMMIRVKEQIEYITDTMSYGKKNGVMTDMADIRFINIIEKAKEIIS